MAACLRVSRRPPESLRRGGANLHGPSSDLPVSLSGPVGSQLTWMGMGFHVGEGSYDQDFDQAFTQRFWAGDGLIAGQSTSSNSAGFGPGMVHITYRFTYTLTTDSPRLHTDSVSTLCQ